MTKCPSPESPLIAVTGATGFLGRHLVERLLSLDVRVLALVRDIGKAKYVLGASNHDQLHFETFELTNELSLSKLEGVSALVNAAAYIPSALEDPSEALNCWQNNSMGTLHLVEQARVAGIPYFMHISTGNAYVVNKEVVNESDPLYPSSRAPYYLISKLAGEVFVDYMHNRHTINTAIFRVSSMYGPRMRNNGVIPSMIGQISASRKIKVKDGGRYYTDFVYVDDVVDCIVASIECGAVGTFNIGSGVATSTFELARTLLSINGRSQHEIELIGERNGPRLGFPALDIKRAQESFSYSPTELELGLLSMLQDGHTEK